MAHAAAWDPHTRSIVEQRLASPGRPSFLKAGEAETLRAAVSRLVCEDRDDILGFILSHIDQKLVSPMGEAQRTQGVPPQAELVRDGLALIDQAARARRGKAFADCSPQEQHTILAELETGSLADTWPRPGPGGQRDGEACRLLQKELFQKLLGLSVEALASHPVIWSEIGYGGPAYPRGYYRIEPGVTDPWEAKAPNP